MSLFTAAGLVDTGQTLFDAIESGGEASVKFLLQQQQGEILPMCIGICEHLRK